MRYCYREMRQSYSVLMENGKLLRGDWNFGVENWKSFGKALPPVHFHSRRFEPDTITREAIAMMNERFAGHPGDLSAFDWPVTPEQAEEALQDFLGTLLPLELGLDLRRREMSPHLLPEWEKSRVRKGASCGIRRSTDQHQWNRELA